MNQLKKALVLGTRFQIVAHMRPAEVGQLREVNVVKTVGVYSVIADDPDAKLSQCNGGKGTFLPLRKASEWSFSDGLCTLYHRKTEHTEEKLCVSFRLVA